MKFFSILFSISLAVCSVSAVQNATATTAITTTSSVVSGTAPLTPAQSTEAACLEACPVGDNSCRSKCIPLADQTNGVADCISSCPKGNGTAADNASYQVRISDDADLRHCAMLTGKQSCVEDCIRSGGTSTTASPEASETASGSESATAGSGSSASSGATGSLPQI